MSNEHRHTAEMASVLCRTQRTASNLKPTMSPVFLPIRSENRKLLRQSTSHIRSVPSAVLSSSTVQYNNNNNNSTADGEGDIGEETNLAVVTTHTWICEFLKSVS